MHFYSERPQRSIPIQRGRVIGERNLEVRIGHDGSHSGIDFFVERRAPRHVPDGYSHTLLPSAHIIANLPEVRHDMWMALIEHKKVRLGYELLEEFEAGLELLGLEVKSLRAGRGKLDGAHIVVRGGEAYLVGASIPPWQPLNAPRDYNPERPRRLLLTEREIAHILSAEGQKGLTAVPIAVYNRGRNLKLSLAIARGRKKADTRSVIREREEKRRIDRTLKGK